MADYFESGFSVREPMWHGKGYIPDRYPESWDEAREWAGLLWEPEARPVYALTQAGPDETDPTFGATFEAIPGHQQIVRNDTNATLGLTSDGYQVITHGEMGEVVEALLDEPNIKYETAGVLRGGREVWALAYIDEPVTLPGDNTVTLPYLALSTRHDGTGSLKAMTTSVRVVCANTLSAAEIESERNQTVFTFTHSKVWRDRVEEARKTISGVRDDFARYVELATDLLNIKVTPAQTERFIVEFIPAPPETLISDRVMNNIEEARRTIRGILAGSTTETTADTAFGLVQAAGEYLDHYRNFRSMDSKFTRQLLRPEKHKSRAVSLVRELVNA